MIHAIFIGELETHHDEIRHRLCVLRPHVPRDMFVISGSSLGPYESQRLLGIGSEADPGADFSKGGRGFVDLDVDVGVFEKGEGGAETTDATADDGDAEGFWGIVRCGHVVLVLS